MRPREQASALSLSLSQGLAGWECNPDRAHSTGLQGGQGASGAVKHHLSGANSMCLVLRTAFSFSHTVGLRELPEHHTDTHLAPVTLELCAPL